uniref:Uncharacterized protein n=1 Tax=Anopheles maculatus TaxID=74869 RepID=A0A182SFX2_9DIPT
MGHIRLNQSNSGAASNSPYGTNGTVTTSQPNPTKDSSSVNVKSFFSCLGGENSQSMNNLNKSAATNGTANGGVPAANGTEGILPGPVSVGPSAGGAGSSGGNGGQGSSIMGGLASAAAVGVNGTGASTSTLGGKSTGAIPKISRKSKQSQQGPLDQLPGGSAQPSLASANGLPPADVSIGGVADPMYANGCGGRVTKPSLQWLLVNKWLPLWVGQTPPDYKFIDFNFMFSRNCDGCSSAGGSHGQQQPPQELVRYGTIDQADYIPPAREYPTMTGSYPRVLRNTPQLARLREHEYENVPLNDPPARGLRGMSPLQLGRARSESPSRVAGSEPLRTWAFNFENNTFRPARSSAALTTSPGLAMNREKPREVRRITDGTYGARDLAQTDAEKPGPSGLASKFAILKQPEPDKEDGRPSSASSSSSDSDNFAIESLAAESGGQPEEDEEEEEEEEEEEDGSTRSADGGRPEDGGRVVGNSTEKENVG